ncbi:MAG: hypothetical protein DMC59_05905, partial [Verrucomicrobia bacterium]
YGHAAADTQPVAHAVVGYGFMWLQAFRLQDFGMQPIRLALQKASCRAISALFLRYRKEKRRRKLLQSVKNMLCFSPLWLF